MKTVSTTNSYISLLQALILGEQIGPSKDWSFIWSVSHSGLTSPWI